MVFFIIIIIIFIRERERERERGKKVVYKFCLASQPLFNPYRDFFLESVRPAVSRPRFIRRAAAVFSLFRASG